MSIPVPSNRLKQQPGWPLAVVMIGSACLWLIIFVAIPPGLQEFPLVDDWAYAHGLFTFAAGQGIHYPKWASMPQLGQWLWALPWVLFFKQSMVALRISTIVLGGIGIGSFYALLRNEGWAPGRSAWAVGCLAFCPLYFLLSGTFMTDVPALSLSLAALALYCRAIQAQEMRGAIAAVSVAVLAAITRQNTLTVPLAAAALLVTQPSLRKQPAWWLAILAPIVAGLLTHFWFQQRSDTMPAEPGVPPAEAILLMPFLILHWCGLVALPVLLLDPRPASWKHFAWACVFMFGNACYWWAKGDRFLVYGGLFPYSDAMLTPWGAYSGELVPGARPILLGFHLRIFFSVLGALAGALLLTRIMERWPKISLVDPLIIFSLLQIPFIFIAPELWDRYMMVLFPGALYLATPGRSTSGGRLLAFGVLLLIGLSSAALMHDWLAWNSARWALGRRMVDGGIKADDIEGGFEWDGWYAPNERPQIRSMKELFKHALRPSQPKGLTLPTTRNWFPHVSGLYALAFSDPGSNTVLDSEPYGQWLLSGTHQFLFLKFEPARTKQPALPQFSGAAPRK
jgi:hypothetical protein